MGYLDYTDAEIRELTRQRRRESAVRRSVAARVVIHGETRFYKAKPLPAEEHAFIGCVPGHVARAIRRDVERDARQTHTRQRHVMHANGPHEHYLSQAMFAKIRGFQDNHCYLCSEPFTPSDDATQDHVVPRALGGKNAGNVLLAHLLCNLIKGDRPPTERELEYLAGIKAKFAAAPAAVIDHSKEIAKQAAFRAAMIASRPKPPSLMARLRATLRRWNWRGLNHK